MRPFSSSLACTSCVVTLLLSAASFVESFSTTPTTSSVVPLFESTTTKRRPNSSRYQGSSSRLHLFQASSTAGVLPNGETQTPLRVSKPVALGTKIGMIAYLASMCVALPLTLLPQLALYKLGWIDRIRKERWSLATGEWCARWMLRLIPFTKLDTIGDIDSEPEPPASIWVCNHNSMLDVFMLMAADKKLRGKHRRPLKIVYWKDLEDNPVTKLIFRQSGFIPVSMAANKPGENNEYDAKSFRSLLKGCKQAFQEGFDIGLLPEGQLNPTPEKGLLPTFTGAFTLARMSKRPIRMLALHGTQHLWHAVQGMAVTNRHVKIRIYPKANYYANADDFKETFETVVGHFGCTGRDLPLKQLNQLLTVEAPPTKKSS